MVRGKNAAEWADEIVGCIFANRLNREEAEKYVAEWLEEMAPTPDLDKMREHLELAQIQLRYSASRKNDRALALVSEALEIATKRTDNGKTTVVLPAQMNCICGAKLPWHLVEIADKRFKNLCSCGRVWRWKSDKSMECP